MRLKHACIVLIDFDSFSHSIMKHFRAKQGLMTELATKFPALGGVDRLRLVERAWGQGYRWWVKAARALQAQAVAAYDRKRIQPNIPAAASVGETDPGLGQLQEKREATRRKMPQRVASPIIQVTATGEISVAGIDRIHDQAQGNKNLRRHPQRVAAIDTESIQTLQNVYGDHATVNQLRHVSTVYSSACLTLAHCETVRRSCIARRLRSLLRSFSRRTHGCASSLVRSRKMRFVLTVFHAGRHDF